VPFGHRDGRTVLIDIAATLGLGLAGPGALDAARAVLVSTLATDPRATVILSDADRHRLLPADSPAAASVARTSGSGSSRSVSDQWSGGRVTVTGRASSMLDYLEAEILTRTRLLEDSHGQITLPPLLVISTVPADTRRLQAVADLGAGLGITMVVLGGWPAGITCFITADGRIGDVRGRHVDEWHLPGLRAFTAGARDTADLLALLTAPSQRSGPPLTGRRARPADPPPVHNPVDGPRTDAAGQAAHSPVIDPATVSPQTTIPGSATLDPAPATTTDGHPPSHGPDSPTHRPGTQDTTPVTSGLTQIAQRLSATDLSTTVAADNVTETDREPTLTIAVLGEVRLFHGTRSADATDAGREITSAIGPRLRELVAFVALHPDGVRRDEVSDALWPDTTPHRHTHALNSALARLRRAASRATGDTVDDLFLRSDQRLRLDPGRVSVDVWEFHRAWDAARAATDTSTRAQAYRRMIDAYGGPLANDVDADWIAAPRQSLHRAATDAVSSLARLLVDKDPQQTLDLLDSARVWDPYNEHLYRDIMRLQARLGQTDAIGRTLELLGVRLAEISAAPSVQTQALAAGLQQRAESSAPDPAATSPTAASPTVARPTSSPGQSGQGTP
jgi:DNA-binding SARP family transcriptional activator